MKGKYLLLAVLFGITAISSCKKDTKNPSPPSPRLSSESWSGGLSFSYQYDAGFRIIKMICSYGFYTTYEYGNTTVTTRTYNSTDGSLMGISTYSLNSKGLATSMQGNGPTGKNWFATYEYDENGYRIKEHYQASDSTGYASYYSITDGNVTTEIYSMNGEIDTLRYTYFPNTTNTFGVENQGISFLGRQSVNLCNLYNKYSNYFGQIPPVSYTYEYDSSKRVTKLIAQGDVSWSATFVYIE